MKFKVTSDIEPNQYQIKAEVLITQFLLWA